MHCNSTLDCCGAFLLYGFEHQTKESKDPREMTYKKHVIARFLREKVLSLMTTTGRAFLIAVLNDVQNDQLADVFEQEGFVDHLQSFNGPHIKQSPLHLWIYYRLPTNSEVKSINTARKARNSWQGELSPQEEVTEESTKKYVTW